MKHLNGFVAGACVIAVDLSADTDTDFRMP